MFGAGLLLSLSESIDLYLNIAANVLTILIITLGFLVTRAFATRWWLASTLHAAMASVHAPTISQSAIRKRIRETSQLGSASVENEVDWLSSVIGANAPADHSLPMLTTSIQLRALSKAYERFATRLGSRAILTTGLVPLINQHHTLAAAVSSYLNDLSNANVLDLAAESKSLDIPSLGTSIKFQALPSVSSGLMAYDLMISSRRHLTIPTGASAWGRTEAGFRSPRRLHCTSLEQQRLVSQFKKPHAFDSTLPRLVGFELGQNVETGRRTLHLSLASCTFSAIVLDHYPGERQVLESTAGQALRPRGVREDTDVSGSQVGLLTLACALVTRDHYMVLVGRSQSIGSFEGFYGPAVSGNMQMPTANTASPDLDNQGLPDLRRAISREAREELGLEIDTSSIHVFGLASFDAPTERGTNVLLAAARVPETLAELPHRIDAADLVEGRWEVGEDLLGIRIPSDLDAGRNILDWAINGQSLTPPARMVALATLASLIELPDLQALVRTDGSEPPVPHEVSKVALGVSPLRLTESPLVHDD